MMTKVFVYGTLKRRHGNNAILQRHGALFLGGAVTSEPYAMLYAGIPYVVRALEGETLDLHPVKGEVYECGEECLRNLDRLEGYSADRLPEHCHYLREEIPVLLRTAPSSDMLEQETTACIYFGNPAIAGRHVGNPVLVNPEGLLVYPGIDWERGEDDEDEDEVVEPDDQDPGDVEGYHDEREMP